MFKFKNIALRLYFKLRSLKWHGGAIIRDTEKIASELIANGKKFDTAPTDYNGLNNPSAFGLPELGEKYMPSKRLHNYLLRYDHVFGEMRFRVKRMVEIGVQTNTSVRMWAEYFPNAEIIGIDIDPDCKKFEDGRIKIVIGDQTDHKFLSDFAKDYFGKIDIIVDDGLHTPEAILTSFKHLYPALSSHGIYSVEDLIRHDYVSSWIQSIVGKINYWPVQMRGKYWQILDDLGDNAGWFAKHTIGVEFYRYIVFIKRGLNPGDNPFIMKKDLFFASSNRGLQEVVDAERVLREAGRAINEENLVEIVGFQQRRYVRDYLSGIRDYERDEYNQISID